MTCRHPTCSLAVHVLRPLFLFCELQTFLSELTEGQPRRHHLHKVSMRKYGMWHVSLWKCIDQCCLQQQGVQSKAMVII